MTTTRKKRSTTQDAEADKQLVKLPSGGRKLPITKDSTADEMLGLAESLVTKAQSSLAPDVLTPNIRTVEKLFHESVGNPPEFAKGLDRSLRTTDHVEQVAQLDETWDKDYAAALNAFDQAAVANGGKVHDANDSWKLAVRIYESEFRTAQAILHAAIEKADPTDVPDYYKGAERTDPKPEVDYYTKSSEVSTALADYQRSSADATNKLATAFGALIEQLFEASTAMAVAEATLIDSSQHASLQYWAGVQSEMESRA